MSCLNCARGGESGGADEFEICLDVLAAAFEFGLLSWTRVADVSNGAGSAVADAFMIEFAGRCRLEEEWRLESSEDLEPYG